MKKTLFAAIAFLAVMAVACQNTGNGDKEAASKEKEFEAQIKQRVEQMINMDVAADAEKLLTADMFALQTMAQGVHFWADYCPGFTWNLGVMDACSLTQEINIEGVKPIDSLHCDVAMRYIDSTCYNDPYTLNLVNENGEWRVNDVTYNEGKSTLRGDCRSFYEEIVNNYRTASPEEIMEFLRQEEPMEELYSDPECIFYNNPEELKNHIQGVRNCQELFKQNPGYTEEIAKEIDAMIERMSAHI